MVVMAILDNVVRDSLSEKPTFEGGEGTRSHVVVWRKSTQTEGINAVDLRPCLREARSPCSCR